jgi:hypothetical protein
MGTSIPEIFEVLTACGSSFRARKILDIGTQNIGLCKADEVVRFVRHFNDVWDPHDLAAYAEIFAAGSDYSPEFGGINGAWLGDILTRAGMEYVAYDIFGGYRTVIFDLNSDVVPAADRGTFDVVINCGTTEHVLNQYNCLKVIHDAVRVDGIIYHAIPMTGYLAHGYFTYTPILFCDLARANRYEILKMNFFGPQGEMRVSEKLVESYGTLAHFDPSDAITARWRDSPVPNSLLTVLLRRTSPAPFRASIETTTTAGRVAARIQGAYEADAATERDASTEAAIATKREAVDQWLDSIAARYTDSTLKFDEIVRLCHAYLEVYPGSQFPPLIEKRGIELALVTYPDRQDLRRRLAEVERSLSVEWPLTQFVSDTHEIDDGLIAEDGIESALLSLPYGKRQFDHAIAAFHRYLGKGKPETFPVALEFRALRYATEHQKPADWSLKQSLGRCAGILSTGMILKEKGIE